MEVDHHQQQRLLDLAITIDELLNDDTNTRIQSLGRIEEIAQALGTDRTVSELLPYLHLYIQNNENNEEILVLVSQKLSQLIPYIGEITPASINSVLCTLESLASFEEKQVYRAALDAIIHITLRFLDSEKVILYIYPILYRLSVSPIYSCRTSATFLYSSVYPNCQLHPDKQTWMRKSLVQLCLDESPIVRRAAVLGLASFVPLITAEQAKQDIMPLFNKCLQDDQDSVRLLCIKPCVQLCQLMEEHDKCTLLLPAIEKLSEDPCWRVRYMVADDFYLVCTIYGHQFTKSHLCKHFASLLQDVEPEVRIACAKQVSLVSSCLDKEDILHHIMPSILMLVSDESEFVRGAIASSIMGLCTLLSKDEVVRILVPLYLQLLRDSDPQVRLNIISRLDSIGSIIGHEELSKSLMPAIIDLALDPKWRIRMDILQNVPIIAKQLGSEFFEQNLSEVCVTWLGDEVYTIRENAVKMITSLVEVFGVAWAIDHIIPRIKDLGLKTNYLYRMTTLFAAIDLIKTTGNVDIIAVLLPMMREMSTDNVPNVRMNAVKAFQVVFEMLLGEKGNVVGKDEIIEGCKQCLEICTQDDDRDVSYFAGKALQQLS